MQPYSEKQIRKLHIEFRELKKYVDKLAFFDRMFDIIPFTFPEFDSQLGFLLDKGETDGLIAIFKNERNNPGLMEKNFLFHETFVFNIKPTNSNSAAYSNYILCRFLSRTPDFIEWIRKNRSAEKSVTTLLEKANDLINGIECRLLYEYDKSLQLQCMSVFYKGFYDSCSNSVHMPFKKRKFIELYLYAQGIIYANYIHALKDDYRLNEEVRNKRIFENA